MFFAECCKKRKIYDAKMSVWFFVASYEVADKISSLKDMWTVLLRIGNGNRGHETSSKRGRSERFTT